MSGRPIDFMRAYAARKPVRFHTPGHKGKLCELDITELSDGSFPSDHIGNAEKRIAEVYGSKHARMLCGGSSQGVKSAVYHAGVPAVIDINSHRSVRDGFRLSAKPYYAVGDEDGLRPLTVSQIDRALRPDVKAVVITTPTYYGYAADIEAVADYCKSKGLLLIADSAHGAHFGFSKRLPKSVAPFCDIANVSTHKTLSALTQSALLFDNLEGEAAKSLTDAVELMGTTSPSYLLYASIDGAVEKATESADKYEALFAPVEALKSELPFLCNDDYTRLVLDCMALGVESSALDRELSARGVYCELNDGKRLVFILTAEDDENTVETLRGELFAAIAEIK